MKWTKLGRILLSQKAYIQQLLRRYKAEGYDSVDTPWGSNVSLASWGLAGPKAGAKGQWSKGARVVTEHEAAEYRSAVSALLWLYKMTRPDLGYALSQLTKYASKPSSAAVDCLKRALAYVKATEDLPLVLRGRVGELNNEEELYIRAWSDSDWAGDKETAVSGRVLRGTARHGDGDYQLVGEATRLCDLVQCRGRIRAAK